MKKMLAFNILACHRLQQNIFIGIKVNPGSLKVIDILQIMYPCRWVNGMNILNAIGLYTVI